MYQKRSATIEKIALVIELLFPLSTHPPYLSHLSHLSDQTCLPHLFYLPHPPLFQLLSLLASLCVIVNS